MSLNHVAMMSDLDSLITKKHILYTVPNGVDIDGDLL